VRRKKNREAAVKFREKRTAQIDVLQKQCFDLQQANDALKAEIVHLKAQVLDLKAQALSHGHCNFPPISKYIYELAHTL